MSLNKMWNDQEQLNRLFRPEGVPADFDAKVALAKEMILHLFSECDELLRALGAWKPHRRVRTLPNRANILNELTDIQRYLITVYQIFEVYPDEALDAFIKKGMVVRQRYSEEFVYSLTNKQLAVIDIDNVLADYVTGMKDFLAHKGFSVPASAIWIDSDSCGIPHEVYRAIRHEFNVQGRYTTLPLMPDAREFLEMLKTYNYTIVLLTARPIHEYPTIYQDTIWWLNHHELPYHYVWWAQDKMDLLKEKGLPEQTMLVVDDDIKYVVQYAGRTQGEVFWLHDQISIGVPPAGVIKVPTLRSLMEMYFNVFKEE